MNSRRTFPAMAVGSCVGGAAMAVRSSVRRAFAA